MEKFLRQEFKSMTGATKGIANHIYCPAHHFAIMSKTSKTSVKFPNLEDFGGYHKFISTFNYTRQELDKLPDHFYESATHLLVIDVSQNNLTELSPSIGQCKQLQELM